ncbi:MAG: hypothetical protein Q8K60_05695 [Parachlamydiaceae bacterium]|nr:hypothetical protein [Parachlamydiaceae bacterium]
MFSLTKFTECKSMVNNFATAVKDTSLNYANNLARNVSATNRNVYLYIATGVALCTIGALTVGFVIKKFTNKVEVIKEQNSSNLNQIKDLGKEILDPDSIQKKENLAESTESTIIMIHNKQSEVTEANVEENKNILPYDVSDTTDFPINNLNNLNSIVLATESSYNVNSQKIQEIEVNSKELNSKELEDEWVATQERRVLESWNDDDLLTQETTLLITQDMKDIQLESFIKNLNNNMIYPVRKKTAE